MSLEWARCLDIFLSIKWGGFGPGDWRGWRSSEQWLLLTCLSILSSCSSGLTHFSFNFFFFSILFLFGYFYALGIPWQLYSEKVLQDAQTNKRMFACGLESLLAAGQSKQWKSDALIFVGNPGQSWANASWGMLFPATHVLISWKAAITGYYMQVLTTGRG